MERTKWYNDVLYRYKGLFVIEKIKEDLHSSNDIFWSLWSCASRIQCQEIWLALQQTGLGLLYEQGQRWRTAWLSSKDDISFTYITTATSWFILPLEIGLLWYFHLRVHALPVSLLNFTEIHETLQGSTKLFWHVGEGLLVFFVMWELCHKIVPTI